MLVCFMDDLNDVEFELILDFRATKASFSALYLFPSHCSPPCRLRVVRDSRPVGLQTLKGRTQHITPLF